MTAYRLGGPPVDARIAQSDGRFRSLFENNHTVMLILDPATRAIVDANPAAATFYGRTRDELIQLHVEDISTTSVDALKITLKSALESPCLPTVARHRQKDGTVRDVEVYNGPFTVGDRRLIYALIHDVTERRRTEMALRLQSAALNAAASAMVITDRSGAVVWVNPAFTTLTGYGPVEAFGRNPRDLLKSGVHDDAFYAELWSTVVSGRIWEGEMTNRRKDGTLYAELQTITPVRGADGEITHFIAIKRDLTEQKALEAQFLQSQKMEVVGRLAGGIAHDFNNLLTVINMTSELGAEALRAGDPLRADFEEIGRAGQRAAALTRQLLAFSRRQILTPEVVDVGTLIESMASMLQRLIGEDIHLIVTVAPDPHRIKADRSQLEQVVMNLAVNARDAMHRGGTLTLEVRNHVLDRVPHVVLAIADTGTGMSEEIQRRIFEPFFTTKEANKGTGLGLSTVYGIVKQSGGTITVKSDLEVGTTFTICLPSVPDLERSGATRAPLPATGRGTLLLVEDEAALCRLASRMLRSVGYTVLTSASAEEALDLLERHDGPIDLMITDVVLPGLSGRELAVRAAASRPDLPVIFTSGYTDDAILRHGVLEDVSHFISKPYTRADLTAKVRDVLARTASRYGDLA
jgi:two-component system, cell cycle sensor histidine kinase and response regulator CckA